MIINPSEHDYRDIYKLMVGVIVPRPIAFVSTVSAGGVRNLAPFSFFTGISANPPVICFSPMIRGSNGTRKDTLRNIEAVKEFVVNVVSEEFAEKMNVCSAEFAPEVDEFEMSGLTPIPSELVKPPRVQESHINLECRLVQIVEVLRFHIDEALFDHNKIDPDKLHAIGRMGGPTYTRTTDLFDMERPKSGQSK